MEAGQAMEWMHVVKSVEEWARRRKVAVAPQAHACVERMRRKRSGPLHICSAAKHSTA